MCVRVCVCVCACVCVLSGLCPAPDPDDGLYSTSSIETLPDPIPELFAVLTEEEDPLRRWTTHTYSYNLDSLLFKPGTGYSSELDSFVTGAGRCACGWINCAVTQPFEISWISARPFLITAFFQRSFHFLDFGFSAKCPVHFASEIILLIHYFCVFFISGIRTHTY